MQNFVLSTDNEVHNCCGLNEPASIEKGGMDSTAKHVHNQRIRGECIFTYYIQDGEVKKVQEVEEIEEEKDG